MKKLMISLAALAAVGAAVPAAAQSWGYGYPASGNSYGYSYRGYDERSAQQLRYEKIAQRREWVERLIVTAERNGRISPWTANRMRQDVSRALHQARSYSRGGLTANEAVAVIAQLDRIGYRLDGRGYGYGYGDRDRDGYGRWR